MKHKVIAFLLILGLLFPMALESQASSKGRRNTAIALGVASVYAYSKGKKGLALAGAAGTAYAYKRYRDSKKREKELAESRRRRYHNRVWCKKHHRYEYRRSGHKRYYR